MTDVSIVEVQVASPDPAVVQVEIEQTPAIIQVLVPGTQGPPGNVTSVNSVTGVDGDVSLSASNIPVVDSGELLTATDVEAALAEIEAALNTVEGDYLTSSDIGSSVQAYDADLDTWAGLTPSANAQSLVTAADYAAMRALLDLEAGTDFYSIAAADAAFLSQAEGDAAYQPLDSDLTTWAGLTPSANAQSLVTAADYAAMRALLDLEAGTDFYSVSGADAAFQPLDADLTSIAALDDSDGNFIVGNGSGWSAESGETVRASLGVREKITGARTYYVDGSSGSDSNDGLSPGAGAFATIQKALDTAGSIDFGPYSVTISIADGTYTEALTVRTIIGSGTLAIVGNTSTPSNVQIATTSANAITFQNIFGAYSISGMDITTTTSGVGLNCSGSGVIVNVGSGVIFGTTAGIQVSVQNGATLQFDAAYTIDGSATRHISMQTGGVLFCLTKTVTLTGTPAFSGEFIFMTTGALARLVGNTYSGSATGQRYDVRSGAVLDISGATLPGDSAGSGTNPSVSPYGLVV